MHPEKQQRIRVYNNFKLLLEKHWKDIDTLDRLDIVSVNIERAVFNYAYKNTPNVLYWSDRFQFHYIDKAVSLYNNLNPESYLYRNNPKLDCIWLDKIIKEEISPHELCFMHYNIIHSSMYKDVELNISACMRSTVSVDEGFIQCVKCKSNKTIYRELQTRSADESADVMVRCTVCNYMWKLDN